MASQKCRRMSKPRDREPKPNFFCRTPFRLGNLPQQPSLPKYSNLNTIFLHKRQKPSIMSPSSTLKTLSTKVNIKLEKVKCRMHKTKASDDNIKVNVEPIQSKEDVQKKVATIVPDQTGEEHTGEDGHELTPPKRCDTTNKQQKAANKQARREARKAKWAARRTTFKANAKKVGEALFLPAAVVGGIIFGPVILVVSFILTVVKMVVWLVMKILDLLCCGPVVVCFACKK